MIHVSVLPHFYFLPDIRISLISNWYVCGSIMQFLLLNQKVSEEDFKNLFCEKLVMNDKLAYEIEIDLSHKFQNAECVLHFTVQHVMHI